MDKIAEVIEATTGEFAAQSYQLHWAPPLGSLVKTCTPMAAPVGEAHEPPLHEPPLHVPVPANEQARTPGAAIYGVVCYSATGSLEPGRRPVARGRDLEEEEEVYRQNPQLARLLCTSFKALIVGYHDGSRVWHYLPPRPPRVHAFVYACRQEEVAAFTRSLDFLTLLLGASLSIPTDELVAACLRTSATARQDGRSFLVGAGKELALLLAGEPARLNAILRKIRP